MKATGMYLMTMNKLKRTT